LQPPAATSSSAAQPCAGTSKPERIAEQVAALELVPKLTEEVVARIEEAAGTAPPQLPVNHGHQYR